MASLMPHHGRHGVLDATSWDDKKGGGMAPLMPHQRGIGTGSGRGSEASRERERERHRHRHRESARQRGI